MLRLPEPAVYSSAPLRYQIGVDLAAPVAEVWALVGDHRRLPEYSFGIEDVTIDADGRTCRFRAMGEMPAVDLTERIRWQIPQVGYATSAVEPNAFGLADDLSVVTVTAIDTGTRFEWSGYFNSADLAAAIASLTRASRTSSNGSWPGSVAVVRHWTQTEPA
jgi:Polyketide cyclase / dehydrase and lipid transport